VVHVLADLVIFIITWVRIRQKMAESRTLLSDVKNVQSVQFIAVNQSIDKQAWITENMLDASTLGFSSDFLRFDLYLTRQKPSDDLSSFFDNERASLAAANTLASNQHKPTEHSLRQALRFGRPDWEEIFYDLKERLAGKTNSVGVFYCGGPGPMEACRAACLKFSSPTGITFYFHAENFGL